MANDASATMIDSVFLAKLVLSELYKEPVEGLADRLKERAPRALTEEGLNAAAEHIIRTHGSGSFPKYPACIAAIEKFNGHNAPVAIAFGSGPAAVTKDTYADRAILFCRRAGVSSFAAKVIKREPDSESQWLTWQAYFAAIEMKGLAGHMRSAQAMTVPTDWPWEFDTFSPVGSAVEPKPVQYFNPNQTRYQEAAE
jgi:hypothetical protein